MLDPQENRAFTLISPSPASTDTAGIASASFENRGAGLSSQAGLPQKVVPKVDSLETDPHRKHQAARINLCALNSAEGPVRLRPGGEVPGQ